MDEYMLFGRKIESDHNTFNSLLGNLASGFNEVVMM